MLSHDLRDVSETPSPASKPQGWIRRRLSPPNPFYLLSGAFILHSTGLGLRETGGFPPQVMMALVGGYVLLMAVIAFAIVRLWNVWDDARSILLIVMLLFLEMALSADQPLVENTRVGVGMLLAGLAITVVVTEIVLLGLRMRLPFVFRGPLYLMWGLLFLYPLVLVPGIQAGRGAEMPWLLLLFPVVTGGAMLTLLPAVRRGRTTIRENGTPWRWPWYPWTIFVFLGVCLLLRSYALCLSFDPALALDFEAAWRLESIYGPYFAVPMLFAVAWLVMEAGIVRGNHTTQLVALALPILCVAMSVPGRGGNIVYRQFVAQIVEVVGSPVWVTVIAAGLFYAVASLRGVKLAWRGVVLCVLALTLVSPQTINLRHFSDIRAWPLFVAAGLLLIPGLLRHRSRWVFEGTLYAFVGTWLLDWSKGWGLSEFQLVAIAVTTAAVLIGGLMRDRFALPLRQCGSLLAVMTAMQMCLQSNSLHDVRWLPMAYLSYLAVLPLTIGWHCRDPFVITAGGANGVQWYTGGLLQSSALLTQWYDWTGGRSFVYGVLLLHVGVALSAMKGGVHLHLAAVFRPDRQQPTSE